MIFEGSNFNPVNDLVLHNLDSVALKYVPESLLGVLQLFIIPGVKRY